jgi:hypothetical protein
VKRTAGAASRAAIVLLVALASSARTDAQLSLSARLTDPSFPTIVQEFPAYDLGLWPLERDDLASERATRLQRGAPDAPETLSALAEAGRIDDAMDELRRMVRTGPSALADALDAVEARLVRAPPLDARDRTAMLREITTEARGRLSGLAREEAARVARQLVWVESPLGSDSSARRAQLARFVRLVRASSTSAPGSSSRRRTARS